MTKNVFVPLMAVMMFVLTGCLGYDDGPKDEVSEITMTISSETGIMYDLFDSKREHPIECMLMMEASDSYWRHLGFNAIEGFAYTRGHYYELRVKKTVLANPPQDDSNCRYSLVRILKDVAPDCNQ